MRELRRDWNPISGKWTMSRIIKEYLQEARGDVAVGDLLEHLRVHGYHVGATLRVLDQFVDVDEKGLVHRKRGGG